MKYEAVIGLEVHVQLNTNSKIFCGCSTQFGNSPNSNVCPVCTGMPGALPVLNEEVVNSAIKIGLGLGCKIAQESVFARKQYFYPDSPKNYQISQYDKPTTYDGSVVLKNGKKLGITRAHIEEDAGKLIHIQDGSLVDFNRTTMPLIEIVSEPDMRIPEEAYEYLMIVKQILRYLEVSDCNMEEGSLRCDANISIRPKTQEELGVKAEVKNLNSFKAVQKAIYYEIERQIDVVESGGKVIQETRLWDEKKEITLSMRSKEEAHDYRYFPEPDLPPLVISTEWINKIKASMPILPSRRKEKLMNDYGLSEYDADVLTNEKDFADYFETVATRRNAKILANWIMVELLAKLNKKNQNIQDSPVSAENLAKLIFLIQNNTISGKIAKIVFEEMFLQGKTADLIIKEKNLVQITDTKAIEAAIDDVLEVNKGAVAEYKAGKIKILGFMVGKVMQKTQGKANPGLVNKMLKEKLDA
ncbi:MAG: Asp-tRNA(Asn)/Glu-tRNA(Gln) amidotransferase subunit GatB [bacterium]|nr:Asp-tRNA(Asn)/Glu-tRNA(Gln) amidotransferase subunit GatB [bacterium]